MGKAVLIASFVLSLMLQSSIVIGSSGQVMKVVDGDTFMMEVTGARGPEKIEVNLRCSDAPILSAPFGKESRAYLESLLHGAEIHFKVQAYCGSESCVEVLAYIPDPLKPQITYINTQMIAAGMARNDACRGLFSEAEAEAKAGKKGIWSTTKKIAFNEAVQVATPGTEKTTKKPSTSALTPKSAPALIEVDRAERTVTLKSKALSLSKAIRAIDSVSTMPVNLYLIEEQYLPLALEKVTWYKALQYLVETANLKQVNMNGKIDLYDQLFYYKHIAPHLKLSDNDGVYINAGSGQKSPAVDDGVTRYVFINDFENSAEEARQLEKEKSGFVQVHQESNPAPVSNYGRFEVVKEKEDSVIATTDPEPAIAPMIDRPEVKPSGVKSAPVEEKPQVAAVDQPSETGAVKASVPEETGVITKVESEETVVKTVAVPEKEKAEESLPTQSSAEKSSPVDNASNSEMVLNIALTKTELAALLVVVVVVILGSILLSRSAARRAAKAEKSIDIDALGQNSDIDAVAAEPLVDSAYEHEVFEDIDHSDARIEVDKTVDEIFRDSPEVSLEPKPEEALEQEHVGQDEPADAEDVAVLETTEEQTVDDVLEDADTAQVSTDKAEESVRAQKAEQSEEEQAAPESKKVKGVATDEGNYAVTLDDYERLMKPPKREPRKDCLFEISCTLDGKSSTGIGLDISRGGLFIDSKEPYTVGKVLELEFKLNEEDREPVRCRCGVTWVNERPDPIKPNYPNGFGICFLDLDTATRAAIDAFLEHNTPAEVEESLNGV